MGASTHCDPDLGQFGCRRPASGILCSEMTSTAQDLLGKGRAALAAGDWAAARSFFSGALEHEESADALYGLARVVEWEGDYATAVGLYERAFAALRALGETRLAALIAGRELSFLYAAVYGNETAAGGWMARARSLAEVSGDCVERGWLELAEALLTDDPDAKDGHVRRATEIAGRFGDADLQFCAMGYEGLCLILRGRIADGILTAAGRWAEAESELSTSIRHYDDSFRAMRSGAVVRLADLRVRQGRLDEAARLLAGFEFDPYAVRPLARLHLARGEVEVASSILRRFLSAAGDHVLHAPVLALLVEVEVAAGRLDEAAVLCRRLSSIAAETELPHVRAVADYAAGVACSAADPPTALRHLETALAAFAAAGLPLEEARTRLAIARLLAGTNAEVAVAEARAALAACDRLDAGPDADAAASLLRSLGSTGRASPRLGGPLTRRESEVLRLVAEGLSNEQIARRLFLSKRTVEHHVGSILAKLGLSTRAEVLAYAARHGPL